MIHSLGCEEFCDYEETREIFETNAARRNFFWTSYQNGPPKTTTPSPTTLPLANRSDDSSYSSGKCRTVISRHTQVEWLKNLLSICVYLPAPFRANFFCSTF